MEVADLYGRKVPASQVPKEILQVKGLKTYPMLEVKDKIIKCLRCGQAQSSKP